jgi:SAM-dependent methyltransferase
MRARGDMNRRDYTARGDRIRSRDTPPGALARRGAASARRARISSCMARASTQPSAAGAPPAPIAVRTEHVRCAVCGEDRARPYRPNMYRIGEVRFTLVRCACGMVYVDPRPDGPTLGLMYADPDYYTEGYNLGVETENYFTRQGELVAQYERTARDLAREIGRTGDLFELGSAGGFFLEGARRAGFRVKGVELSPPAVAFARRELGLEIFEGLLEDSPWTEPSFDVAYADNVLEHTTSPEAVLRRLHALLRPGGHLVVIVPSYVNSMYFRLLLTAQKLIPQRFLGPELLRILKFDPDHDGGYPYHILEFDRARLATLVERAGFEIVSCEGSLPLPAHLFKVANPSLRVRCLRAAFRTMDFFMRLGWLPGARVRILARRR